MFGLLILIVALLVIISLWGMGRLLIDEWFLKNVRSYAKKSIAWSIYTILMSALFVGDETYNRIKVHQACKKYEFGEIYKVEHDVNGYFLEDRINGEGIYDEYLFNRDYEFIEGKNNKKLYRYSLDSSGGLLEIPIDKPKAKHKLTRYIEKFGDKDNIEVNNYIVSSLDGSEIYAESRDVRVFKNKIWFVSWLLGQVTGGGSVGSCSGEYYSVKFNVNKVLIPNKRSL